MSCNCLKIPDDAEVLTRATTWNRVVYRQGECVIKILKESVRPGLVQKKQRLAAEHPDVFAAFEYDVQRHAIVQPFMGYDSPTAAEFSAIRAAIAERRIGVSDVKYDNIRGGRLIDFDLFLQASIPKMPRGVTKRNGVITVNAATREEIVAAKLGKAIVWPAERDSGLVAGD